MTESLDKSETQIDHLVRLLEFEISRIRTVEARNGWNKWTLWGALAVVLRFAALELGSINLRGLLGILLSLATVSMAWEFLKALANFIPTGHLNRKGARFLPIYEFLAPRRIQLLFEFLRATIFVMIALWLKSIIGVYSIIMAVFFGINAFVFISGFLISFQERFINFGDQRRRDTLNSALLVLAAISFLGLLIAFWNQIVSPLTGSLGNLSLESASRLASELRIGGLLAASIIILQVLTYVDSPSPLLESLVEIRRDVGLGRLRVETAKQQTEIALLGLTVSHVFQGKLSRMLSTLHQATFHIDQESAKYEEMTQIIEKHENGIPAAEFQEVETSLDAHRKSAMEALKKFQEHFRDFVKYSNTFLKSYPECEDEVAALKSKISLAFARVLAAQKKSTEQANKLKEILGI